MLSSIDHQRFHADVLGLLFRLEYPSGLSAPWGECVTSDDTGLITAALHTKARLVHKRRHVQRYVARRSEGSVKRLEIGHQTISLPQL